MMDAQELKDELALVKRARSVEPVFSEGNQTFGIAFTPLHLEGNESLTRLYRKVLATALQRHKEVVAALVSYELDRVREFLLKESRIAIGLLDQAVKSESEADR